MANDTPSRIGTILLGLLFALIGIGLLGIAVNLTLDRRDFLARAQTADGIVSRLNAGGSHPEIAFTTGKGEKFPTPRVASSSAMSRGSRCEFIICPSSRPPTPRRGSRCTVGTPVMLGAMGLFFTLVGLLKATRQRGRDAVHSHKGL